MGMKVHLAFLGCKLNQSEMEALQAQLAEAGWTPAPAEEADVVVLNTCAVTAEAARKSRQALRRLRAQATNARLVATGCYAELWPGEIAEAARPDLVVGNQDKSRLAEILDGETQPLPPSPSPIRRGGEGVRSPAWPRTRAFVKIQDGCDNACAYCVVHVARGPSRSVLPDEVVAQVRRAAEVGRREVVLTGVNIGAYGEETGGPDLGGLLARLLRETGVARIRLSSVEPWSFREDWLALWENPRLCRHLHLPLQSGSDAVLRRMNRPYLAEDFLRLARAAQAALPDLALTTDIIAGFPGETESDHSDTLALMEEVRFLKSHIFPFSPRPGTPAAVMNAQVPRDATLQRSAELRALDARLATAFALRFVGKTMEVLWEQSRKGSLWTGLTGNYLRVFAGSDRDLSNRITPVFLMERVKGGVRGSVVPIDKGNTEPV
jgi:threonylcarbamoyladenosine tRNA methylthiotransferase MtaB